jgi:co-chaperonin GroES (HSP10)
MNRIMLNDTVLIRREQKKDEVYAGTELVKSEHFQQSSNHGTVLAIGAAEAEIKVDDIVVFSKVSEEEVEIDGETLVRIHRKGVFWIER